jgi:hypothetical protein
MRAAARVLALLLRGLRAVLRSPHFILYDRGRLSYSVFVHQLFPLQSQPDPLAFLLIGLRMQLHGAGWAR